MFEQESLINNLLIKYSFYLNDRQVECMMARLLSESFPANDHGYTAPDEGADQPSLSLPPWHESKPAGHYKKEVL
jgi:hypothetical protein